MVSIKFTLVLLLVTVLSIESAKLKKRSTCGTPSKLETSGATASLKSHNGLRSHENAADELEMTYSQSLADRSQEWSDKCLWDHGMTTLCNGDSVGQNMYLAGGGSQFPTVNMTKVVESWYNEKSDYDYATKTCKPGKMCGHYTQVVWSKSKEVGCGYTQCPTVSVSGSVWKNAVIVVCDYSPAGNYENTKIYEQGTVCSRCASQVEEGGYLCNNHLCSPCLPKDNPDCKCDKASNCENGGVWDQGICSCSCKPGFYGKSCQNSCVCQDLQPDACAGWTSFCSISAYDAFMKQNCPKTCGKCNLPETCKT